MTTFILFIKYCVCFYFRYICKIALRNDESLENTMSRIVIWNPFLFLLVY